MNKAVFGFVLPAAMGAALLAGVAAAQQDAAPRELDEEFGEWLARRGIQLEDVDVRTLSEYTAELGRARRGKLAPTTIGPILAPATSRSGSVTSVAVEVPVTPMTWTDRPAPPASPARSITSGEMTVRSAPVSTIKVSATPLRRASPVIGAPGETLSATGSFAAGGGIGRW